MKLQHGNTQGMLDNVRRYFYDNHTSFSAVVTEPALAKLDAAMADLANAARAQDQYMRDMRGHVAGCASRRLALVRDHMRPIAKIAKLELSDTPELMKLSLPRKSVSVHQLAALAEGMAEAARPHAQVFIDSGRSPDFIERLKAAAQDMRASQLDSGQQRARIRGTTASLEQKAKRAKKVVQVLDALVKEAVGNDTALLASWKSAKRIRAANSAPQSAATTVGSIPAATAPATTTSVAA